MRSYIRFDLADNCNIRCIMCQAYNGLPVTNVGFLEFEKFAKHTSGEIGKWQTIQLGNVAEATIHPRFGDFLRFIRKETPATIHIVTNGKRLDRWAKEINEVGNCLVQVSVDSVRKETHEYIRAGSNFERLVSSLSLIDLSRNRVLLSFTLMKSNIREYPEMVEFCRSHGYSLSAYPMILRDETGVIPLSLVKESLWFSLSTLKDWLQDHYGKDYERIVEGAAPGTSNLGIDAFSCNAHQEDLIVDAKGEAVLCYKVGLGNINRSSLVDLWNSPAAVHFRREVDSDRGPCMTCDYRQRCLAPSMSLLENHFSERIANALSPETRRAIGYNRNISDEDAMELFVRAVGRVMGIYDITRAGSKFHAIRIPDANAVGTLEAGSRHELHEKMVAAVATPLCPRLVESIGAFNIVAYDSVFWAIPLSLGHVDLTRAADRQRAGIIVASSIEDIQKRVGALPGHAAPPKLLETLGAYNLVAYSGRYWALPLSLGHVDLTHASDQKLAGIIVKTTMNELRASLVH